MPAYQDTNERSGFIVNGALVSASAAQAQALAGDTAATGTITFSTNPTGQAAAVAATGSIVFTVNPTENDTITLAGTAVTFVASGPTGEQVEIGGDLDATLAALLTFLQASVDANLVKLTYALGGTGNETLRLTAATAGAAGNSLTVASSNGANTRSGATLTGGADAITGDTITLGGQAVTFTAGTAGANQVQVAGTLALTLAALAAALNASTDTNISKCSYSASATVLTITDKTGGVAGNSFTIAASAASASGSVLSGGAITGGAVMYEFTDAYMLPFNHQTLSFRPSCAYLLDAALETALLAASAPMTAY